MTTRRNPAACCGCSATLRLMGAIMAALRPASPIACPNVLCFWSREQGAQCAMLVRHPREPCRVIDTLWSAAHGPVEVQSLCPPMACCIGPLTFRMSDHHRGSGCW